MAKKDSVGKPTLRSRAESIVEQRKAVGHPLDTEKLLHELKVHQIELELQNAELCDAQLQLEGALRRYTHLYQFGPVAYFTLDEAGVITQLNIAASRLLGGNGFELAGRHFRDFLEGTSRRDFAAFQKRALSSDRIRSGDLTLSASSKTTQPRTVRLETAPADRAQCLNIVAFDITERIGYERKLQEFEMMLKARDRQKDEFIAMLSHEFRNPLAAINYANAVLNRLESTDPQVTWVGKAIAGQVEHLNRLVDDALDISRIAQGKFELKLTQIGLGELIARVLAISRPFIEDLGHCLELEECQEPLVLEADPARIVQVMDNVLHNAAKYTPKGGRIRLRTARDGHSLVIKVTDEGVGISPERLPMVFSLYSRGSENPNQVPAGLGIGLTLAERLIRLHHGSIAIESAGIGAGCEVSIRLPLATSEPWVHPALAAAPDEAAIPPLRVLVVDDDPDVAATFGMLLRMMGHGVEIVLCGDEALAAAEAMQPQVIFMDISMPGLNGFDVLRGFRSMARWKDLPIIAVTGYGQKSDIKRSLEAGFQAHLVKPVELKTLTTALRQVATRH